MKINIAHAGRIADHLTRYLEGYQKSVSARISSKLCGGAAVYIALGITSKKPGEWNNVKIFPHQFLRQIKIHTPLFL
jgi:hypothetical protein